MLGTFSMVSEDLIVKNRYHYNLHSKSNIEQAVIEY